MRFSLTIAGATSATHTSPIIALTGYTSGGTYTNVLKLDYRVEYENNDVTDITVSHCATKTGTYTDLWAIGDPDTATVDWKALNSWYEYVKATAAYSAPSAPDGENDPGFRVRVEGHVWGPPNWGAVVACRDEHLEAVRAILVDSSKNFPPLDRFKAAAKGTLERALRGRGINPWRLITDGHNEEPCIEGLETAGAALCLHYVLTGGRGAGSERMDAMRSQVWELYTSELDSALSSGSVQEDTSLDSSPDGDSPSRPPAVIL